MRIRTLSFVALSLASLLSCNSEQAAETNTLREPAPAALPCLGMFSAGCFQRCRLLPLRPMKPGNR